jgi:hypothetical protein
LGVLVAVGAVLSLPSCGFKKRLVEITINPPAATITGAGVEIDFQALGTYIHPPETENITTSVVWASTANGLVTIDANTGVAFSGIDCGTVSITATAPSDPQNDSGGVVVGTALVTVNQPGNCQ